MPTVKRQKPASSHGNIALTSKKTSLQEAGYDVEEEVEAGQNGKPDIVVWRISKRADLTADQT